MLLSGCCLGGTGVAEVGIAILIVAVLLLTDQDRVQWLLEKMQQLLQWLSAEQP